MDEQAFKLFLAQKGLRNRTIESRISTFNQLKNHVSNWNKESLVNYLMGLQEKGCKGSYLNTFILVSRDICRWKEIEDFKIPLFKLEESYKSTLSQDEIKKLLSLKPKTGGEKYRAKWDRWTLFFQIMAYCGMRPSEVAGLTTESCDFGRQVFVLKQTKTTPRLVPMPTVISNSLLYHLKLTHNGILFPNPTNKIGVFDKDDWRFAFKNRLDMLGIKREGLTIYSLRHSFITRMLEEDVNIFKVQKIVGHRRLETTNRYTHLTTKDIIKSIKKDPLTRRGNTQEEVVQAIVEALKGFHIEEDKRFRFTLLEGTRQLEFKLNW